MLNGGMVGYSLCHSDIGGYSTVPLPENLLWFVRDAETLVRWMEMSAFSDALFRTHPSSFPPIN